MTKKTLNCPLCNSELEENDFLYGNHKNSFKKKLLGSLYYLVFLLIPKKLFLYIRIPRRITHSIWFGLKINPCKNCGLYSLNKVPSKKLLAIWYNSVGNTSYFSLKENSTYSKRTFSQLEYLKKNFDLNTLRNSLEFGAGDGELSQILKNEYSIETTTVDISKDSNRYLRGTNLIDFVEEDFPTKKTYDLIICSHVLHLIHNFPEIIHIIDGSLSRSGFLFVETPNITDIYFNHDAQDAPYIWFLNKNIFEYFSSNYAQEILDISFFGPRWEEFINKGVKNDEPSVLKDSIILRSIMKKL